MKFLCSVSLFIFINSTAQTLDGVYTIYKIRSGKGTKEVFYFFNDTCFRFQNHSLGIISVGEGTYRMTRDSLFLVFGNCKSCLMEMSETANADSTRKENWIFLRTIMPWRIALWGIRNEIRAYKISRQTKSLLTLRAKKNIVTYRNLKGKEEERFKKSFQQYFFE